MKSLIEQGKHIVFADESIFKARDFSIQAWSNLNENVYVEDRTAGQPC